MVARHSRLRVSPSCIVFESAILFSTVPGPMMKLRGVLPNTLHGYGEPGEIEGSINAAGLNHCRPVLRFNGVPVRFGRNVPPVPHAKLSCDAGNTGVSGVPLANVKLPETENPSRMCEPVPVVTQRLSWPKANSYKEVPVTLCLTSTLEFPSSSFRFVQSCAPTPPTLPT